MQRKKLNRPKCLNFVIQGTKVEQKKNKGPKSSKKNIRDQSET